MPSSRRPSLRSALKKGEVSKAPVVESVELDQWSLNFVRILRPKNFMRAPVVILSGILQSFQDFSEEMEALAEHYPVYMVELPGLGENKQVATDLDFEKMAELLKDFLDVMGVEKINLMTFSTTTPITFYFAQSYAERLHKACFIGATLEYRASIKACLKDILSSLEHKNMEAFACSMVMTFMNFSKKDKVRYGSDMGQKLYQKLLKVDEDENDYQRMRVNLLRLINSTSLGSGPSCPTLVLAGEFDNFTTAYEGHLVTKKCRHSKLAIIKSSDHLVAQQKQTQVLKALNHFFSDQEIQGLRGIHPWSKKEFPISARRLHPRWQVNEQGKMNTKYGDIQVVIEEISVEGCRFRLVPDKGVDPQAIEKENSLCLELKKWGLRSELLIFAQGGLSFTALFRSSNFEVAEKTSQIVQRMVSA